MDTNTIVMALKTKLITFIFNIVISNIKFKIAYNDCQGFIQDFLLGGRTMHQCFLPPA